MIYSEYNYIVYKNQSGDIVVERPLLKSHRLANEFLAMQYARFRDEGDRVKLALIDTTELGSDSSITELAEVSCMQFSDEPKSLDADYYTVIDQMRIISLDVERGIFSAELQVRDKDNNIFRSSYIDLSDSVDVNKLVLVVESTQGISNLSPIIHEYSEIPHNDILDKIITLKSLDEIMQTKVIDGTFNNQAGISLGDKLVDYEIEVTPSWSTYEGKLLINGEEAYG